MFAVYTSNFHHLHVQCLPFAFASFPGCISNDRRAYVQLSTLILPILAIVVVHTSDVRRSCFQRPTYRFVKLNKIKSGNLTKCRRWAPGTVWRLFFNFRKRSMSSRSHGTRISRFGEKVCPNIIWYPDTQFLRRFVLAK